MEYSYLDGKEHAVAFPIVSGDCRWPRVVSYKLIHLQERYQVLYELENNLFIVWPGPFIKSCSNLQKERTTEAWDSGIKERSWNKSFETYPRKCSILINC